jgi:hypothetical protein
MRLIRIYIGLVLGCFALIAPSGAAEPPAAGAPPDPVVTAVATYGFRTVAPDEAIKIAGIHVGDDVRKLDLGSVKSRLKEIKGVQAAEASAVYGRLLDGDKPGFVVYLGILEDSGSPIEFRSPPTTKKQLPLEVIKADELEQRLLEKVIARGDFAEDRSQGYSLSKDKSLRSAQLAYVALAATQWSALIETLHDSDDAKQRATAAKVIAYSENRSAVAKELTFAATDPDPGVRNNAVRALSLLYAYATANKTPLAPAPELIQLAVAMLDSVNWTDRNKGLALLLSLDGYPAVLVELRKNSIPSLVEMCHWPPGHGVMAYMLLGTLGGKSHEAAQAEWRDGERDKLIVQAERAARAPQ